MTAVSPEGFSLTSVSTGRPFFLPLQKNEIPDSARPFWKPAGGLLQFFESARHKAAGWPSGWCCVVCASGGGANWSEVAVA